MKISETLKKKGWVIDHDGQKGGINQRKKTKLILPRVASRRDFTVNVDGKKELGVTRKLTKSASYKWNDLPNR